MHALLYPIHLAVLTSAVSAVSAARPTTNTLNSNWTLARNPCTMRYSARERAFPDRKSLLGIGWRVDLHLLNGDGGDSEAGGGSMAIHAAASKRRLVARWFVHEPTVASSSAVGPADCMPAVRQMSAVLGERAQLSMR